MWLLIGAEEKEGRMGICMGHEKFTNNTYK